VIQGLLEAKLITKLENNIEMEDLSAEITILKSISKEKKPVKITKLRDIINSQADPIAIVKKIIDGKIELTVDKAYTNISTLQKLMFAKEVSNLKEFKKYISQGESARVGLVKIKDLDTEPLRPVYYTSETPKARVIINS